MNTTTAYTPLESLLLFQSLAVSGTEPDVFIHTSNILKRNALIRDSESYDPGRLSSDALRELYLSLLRDEVAHEAQQDDGRGDSSPSRKRKLSTPPIANIRDANHYSEKVPLMVDRLYTRYRDLMIKSIREDERKYALLQREISEIERGEWDERLQKDDRIGYTRTPNVVPTAANEGPISKTATNESPNPAKMIIDKQILDVAQPPVPREQVDPPNSRSPPRATSSHRGPQADGMAVGEVFHNRVSSDPPASMQPAPNGLQVLRPLGHQRTPSHERQPPPPPLQPLQSMPPENWKWEQYPAGQPGPQAPPLYPINPSYPAFISPQYPAYPPGPPRGSFSGIPAHGIPLSQSHVSPPPTTNQPLVLPPPNLGPSAGSPGTRHLDQLADVAELQYRAPTASPSMHQGVMPGPQYGPQYSGYPAHYRTSDGRPASGNGIPQQWSPRFVPHFVPPLNYNYTAQPMPSQGPFPLRDDIIQSGQPEYKSPYVPNQNARLIMPSSSSTPRPPHLGDGGSLPHTPAYKPPRYSTGKGTRWTPNPTPGTPKAPQSPKQPEYEPLSPVLPVTHPNKPPRASEKVKRDGPNSENRARVKGQTVRRRNQAGSPVSSALTGSYRSESVMSHADELSLANENIGQNFKRESATPRALDDIGDTTADESITLRRGLKAQVRPRKRKLEESHLREPSAPPTHVRWTRNFPKISASALERIGAHRYASIFSQPIKERDAPGYKNIILRPQDLKSIRTAINSGLKHGTAIASSMGDSGQASILLPVSEDLIPPKGIVNNSQVEKELMRMFANAIMFNHGPNRGFGKVFEVAASIEESGGGDKYELDENSVVNDTRAMFADVEKIVGEMRSAEWKQEKEARRQLEDDDLDELAGGSDMASGSVAKRRRR